MDDRVCRPGLASATSEPRSGADSADVERRAEFGKAWPHGMQPHDRRDAVPVPTAGPGVSAGTDASDCHRCRGCRPAHVLAMAAVGSSESYARRARTGSWVSMWRTDRTCGTRADAYGNRPRSRRRQSRVVWGREGGAIAIYLATGRHLPTHLSTRLERTKPARRVVGGRLGSSSLSVAESRRDDASAQLPLTQAGGCAALSRRLGLSCAAS
jgi:hypothetical protein